MPPEEARNKKKMEETVQAQKSSHGTKAREEIYLTSDEEESDDSSGEEKSEEKTASKRQGNGGAATKLEAAWLQTVYVTVGKNTREFRIIEPTNIRGIRVEATKESVRRVIALCSDYLARASLEITAEEPAGPKSWKRKAEDAEQIETQMPSVQGVIGWNPSHKSWTIYFKEGASADLPRKINEIKVLVKDKQGVAPPRKQFLEAKHSAYQKACTQWNKLDNTTRKRLKVPQEE